MIEFQSNFSRQVLLRLLVVLAITAVGVVLSRDFIYHFYFHDQGTITGFVINGGILLLFLLGIGEIVWLLLRYAREERALARFLRALEGDVYTTVDSVDARSLIQRRLKALQKLAKMNAPINHGALAATLVANENTRLGLVKFVHSTLVLTGVFGTIVSLGIALLGASNLLDAGQELGNMKLIIHGMSTALNTTLTAIVAYFIFGYFYLKVLDVKTHLIAAIEQVTALYLLPRYGASADTLLQDVANLARNLRQVSEAMQVAQHEMTQATRALREMMDAASRRVTPLTDDVVAIRKLLREGFRLPEGQ